MWLFGTSDFKLLKIENNPEKRRVILRSMNQKVKDLASFFGDLNNEINSAKNNLPRKANSDQFDVELEESIEQIKIKKKFFLDKLNEIL